MQGISREGRRDLQDGKCMCNFSRWVVSVIDFPLKKLCDSFCSTILSFHMSDARFVTVKLWTAVRSCV